LTRPDITYVVGGVSICMLRVNLTLMFFFVSCVILRVPLVSIYKPGANLFDTSFSDVDWAASRSNRRSTSGYFTFFSGNLVTWRRPMTHIASKMLWVCSLCDLGLDVATPMQMHCENQATIFIANNFVFHVHTKHMY
jgi:hypothetical protein